MRATLTADVSFWIDQRDSTLHRVIRLPNCERAFLVPECDRVSAPERPVSAREAIRFVDSGGATLCRKCNAPALEAEPDAAAEGE